MDLDYMHREVARRLEHVDPGTLWPGLAWGEFALYNACQATLGQGLFPRPEVFRGNTALTWEERTIAIWQVTREDGEDLDLLAANMAHELFHVFQLERGESRFPNDLAALTDPMESNLLAVKREENRELVRSVEEQDREKGRDHLARFLALRKERETLSGRPCPQEYWAETVEGMAEYVGARALNALSGEKYARRLKAYEKNLTEPSPLLLDPRRMAYNTGTLLLLGAQKTGLPLFHEIGEEKRPVCELLKDKLLPAPVGTVPPFPQGETLLEAQRKSREAVLAAFFDRDPQYRQGNFFITGYDPMNLWLLGDKLYGSHFWVLKNRDGGETVQLQGPAVLVWNGEEVAGFWTEEKERNERTQCVM